MIIDYFLPQKKLFNQDIEKIFNDPKWTAQKIFQKTGIQARHVVTEELASDLAVGAAEALFEKTGIDRTTIDFMLLCTQSPDYFLPTTACLVQDRLGLPTSLGALDFNLGCSGYVYGLALAKGLLKTYASKRLLLITSEIYSRHIHPMDKSTRTIFGDGATATLLEEEDVNRIGQFVFGTDGSGAPNLMVPAGGMALPRSRETAKEESDKAGNVRSANNLYMNGPEIFSFTLRAVPDLIKKTLKKNNLTMSDIDCFIFHQANKFILESLRDKLEIPHDRFVIDVEEVGNTVSSTIPIALQRSLEQGIINKGDKVLIAGFGVGYSLAATVLSV